MQKLGFDIFLFYLKLFLHKITAKFYSKGTL